MVFYVKAILIMDYRLKRMHACHVDGMLCYSQLLTIESLHISDNPTSIDNRKEEVK